MYPIPDNNAYYTDNTVVDQVRVEDITSCCRSHYLASVQAYFTGSKYGLEMLYEHS